MKRYLSGRELLRAVERLLVAKTAPGRHSPLEDVSQLLASGRHYSWTGIYLAVGKNAGQKKSSREPQPGEMAHSGSKSKILISMKLAGREFGVLDVESERPNAFGIEDRVLLENVADRLARFLAGPGRYLVRKARGAA